ncbi:MAG TPA: DUF2441 domain-containing protein [Burkholderiales bacterium]|nr:DUF2441 domain-containing protein [Burkholderiales bacterium]
MPWEKQGDEIVHSDGRRHRLLPFEGWHLAPTRVAYKMGESHVRFTDFAILLHNVRMGEGVICSMRRLLDGTGPLVTHKKGASAEAENLLEELRKKEFPKRPSRLACHFLGLEKEVAEYWLHHMFGGHRLLTRCYIVEDHGPIHLGDAGLYEKLENNPANVDLARRYWAERFEPKTIHERRRAEVLSDNGLYFPDWQDFPVLDEQALRLWQAEHL